jgi:CDP-diacylglycerol---serine O-phosphatidyltransferase
MTRHIPNFLTCCNLLCGFLGVLNLFNFGMPDFNNQAREPFFATGIFVWAACVFDFFDGFAARALKVSSPIGKELDSLADLVSFGVLPAMFMFTFIQQQIDFRIAEPGEFPITSYLPFIAVLIVILSAVRLAIFNVDETQKDSFRGLPTPANALFLTGLPFLSFPEADFIHSPIVLIIITIVFSLLLVSRVELFALKFKNFSWADNKLRFTFLLLSVLLFAIFITAAIPLIIILYILLSLGNRAFSR